MKRPFSGALFPPTLAGVLALIRGALGLSSKQGMNCRARSGNCFIAEPVAASGFEIISLFMWSSLHLCPLFRDRLDRGAIRLDAFFNGLNCIVQDLPRYVTRSLDTLGSRPIARSIP